MNRIDLLIIAPTWPGSPSLACAFASAADMRDYFLADRDIPCGPFRFDRRG